MNLLDGQAWQKVLPIADGRNIHEISRETHITYAHLLKIIRAFEERGWVTTKKQGRQRVVSLTASGEMIARPLRNLKDVIKPWEDIK